MIRGNSCWILLLEQILFWCQTIFFLSCGFFFSFVYLTHKQSPLWVSTIFKSFPLESDAHNNIIISPWEHIFLFFNSKRRKKKFSFLHFFCHCFFGWITIKRIPHIYHTAFLNKCGFPIYMRLYAIVFSNLKLRVGTIVLQLILYVDKFQTPIFIKDKAATCLTFFRFHACLYGIISKWPNLLHQFIIQFRRIVIRKSNLRIIVGFFSRF